MSRRDRFYSMEGVSSVEMWKYHCIAHSQNITLEEYRLEDYQIAAFVDQKPIEVLILPRTIITQELWKHIIMLYLETHNESMIARTITQQWHTTLNTLSKQVRSVIYMITHKYE